MSPRARLNLALLVVVAVLALLARWEPGHDAETGPVRLSPIVPASVGSIRIRRPGRPDIRLTREAAGWRMHEPWDLPANTLRVRGILAVLAAARYAALPAEPDGLGRYGLRTPLAGLELDDSELLFGDTEPLSGRRYVRLGGAIYLTDDDFLHQLTTSAASFVDPHLLPRDARLVLLRLPDQTLRRDGPGWRLEPERPAIGADAIARLIEAWSEAQAVSVQTYPVPDTGPEVVVGLADPARRLRFRIRRDAQELVLGRPEIGIAYHLPGPVAGHLLHLPEPP